MEHGSNWLQLSLVYLGAAVLAVPLARLLGLGSVIGYLAAGIAIGPWGLRLVTEPQTMLHAAEFGVVLMLFLVGLELQPRRLWTLRRPILGWGSVQLLGSAALIAAAGVALGAPWRVAVVAGLALAMSSTAIGLAVLSERNLMATPAGQGVLSVSLLQDMAAIPILAVVPMLALAGPAVHQAGGFVGVLQALAVVAGVVFGGRLLLRPALRWIAGSRTPEIFTAAALLLVVATASLMASVGLSMALGAFLAGVLLAESEYRRALETDLEPFKGLLLGLFFIAVGMSIDFGVVLRQPALVAAIVAGCLLMKAAVLLAMLRFMAVPASERPLFVVLLAQGGEFGFVVLQGALGARVVDAATGSLLVAAIALSMLLTPLLLFAVDRWRAAGAGRAAVTVPPEAELSVEQQAPVVIAGFGRYGQIVGRLLSAAGLKATVLDHDVEQIETLRRFGWNAFYGDATRLDLLRTAGAGQARVFVLAIDDVEQSVSVARMVREHFPQAEVVARARNVTHYARLREAGVRHIERETFDAALQSARSVLQAMGWESGDAERAAARFRRHNVELLEAMLPHMGDQGRLVALATQGRQQLEALWAQERAAAGTGTGTGPDPENRDGAAARPPDAEAGAGRA